MLKCRLCKGMVAWEDFKLHIQKIHNIEYARTTGAYDDGSIANFVASYALDVNDQFFKDQEFYSKNVIVVKQEKPIMWKGEIYIEDGRDAF